VTTIAVLTDFDMFNISKATNATVRIIARPKGLPATAEIHDISVPAKVYHTFTGESDPEIIQTAFRWLADEFNVEFREKSEADKLRADMAAMRAEMDKLKADVQKQPETKAAAGDDKKK
jgi:hypothetical protein